LLIRSELFRRLGGFDERYVPCYYEDSDLCFGVRNEGQRRGLSAGVRDFPSWSQRGRAGEDRGAVCGQPAKVRKKWSDALRHRVEGRMPGDLILARDLRPGLRVLVIDAPTSNAADELANRDCVVTYVPRGPCDPQTTFRLRQRGIEVLPGDDASILDLMTKRLGCFEAVVVGSLEDRESLLDLVRRRLPLTSWFGDAPTALGFALGNQRETQSGKRLAG